MQEYDNDFYKNRDPETRFAARTILSLVRRAIPEISAAVDVGCGVGTWLRVLGEQGTAEIVGIDGDWVHDEALVIPSQCFIRSNLSENDIRLDRRYDLVISLEVAEHLPAQRAEQFVTQLTSLGDFVLFSAAIPGQGGTNHVNEQWPEYWISRFEARGYRVFDIIRSAIWAEARISPHYRQNILLFVKAERVVDLKLGDQVQRPAPFSVVHPELYLSKLNNLQNPTIPQSVGLLAVALRRRVKRHFGAGS